MPRLLAAFIVSALIFVPAAGAATKLPDRLTVPDDRDCVSDGGTAQGYLRLNTDDNTFKPTTYTFAAPGEKDATGSWTWDGKLHFTSGPLQGSPGDDWVGSYTKTQKTIPNDPIPGRTADLVLRKSNADWYCGRSGVVSATVVKSVTRTTIKRRTGLTVLLPTWLNTFSQSGDRRRLTAFTAKAKQGEYSIELGPPGCKKFSCGMGWLNAHKASASELGKRTRVSLAKGIHGYVGNVGCGPGGDWGPTVCGQSVVVWHTGGINYAIQMNGAEDADLVRYAKDMIVNGAGGTGA